MNFFTKQIAKLLKKSILIPNSIYSFCFHFDSQFKTFKLANLCLIYEVYSQNNQTQQTSLGHCTYEVLLLVTLSADTSKRSASIEGPTLRVFYRKQITFGAVVLVE